VGFAGEHLGAGLGVPADRNPAHPVALGAQEVKIADDAGEAIGLRRGSGVGRAVEVVHGVPPAAG